jgi:hypothetical protein
LRALTSFVFTRFFGFEPGHRSTIAFGPNRKIRPVPYRHPFALPSLCESQRYETVLALTAIASRLLASLAATTTTTTTITTTTTTTTMTNENGTPAQQRKRVRLDEEVTVLGETPATITPSIASTKLVSAAVASYPVPIQSFIKQTSQRYNALKSKQRQQESSLAKLAEATFIPRSIRVQVSLTAPTSVMENDKFKKHKTDMESALKVYQTACKKAISGTAELVNEAMKTEIGQLLVTTLINIASLLILTKPTKFVHHRLAYYVTNTHIPDSVFTSTWTNKSDVLKAIFENSPSTMDVETTFDADDPPAVANPLPIPAWAITDTEEKAFFESLQQQFTNLVLTIFVNSWKAQLDTYQQKETDLALAACAKRIMGLDATTSTAQTVDAEPSVGPKVVKEMIDLAINQKMKKVETSVNKLSEKIQRSAKNSTRGTKKTATNSSGAPSPKNKKGKGNAKNDDAAGKKKENKNPKNRGRSPGKKDTDTRNANKSKSPKRGRSPGNKKNTSSKKRGNKS